MENHGQQITEKWCGSPICWETTGAKLQLCIHGSNEASKDCRFLSAMQRRLFQRRCSEFRPWRNRTNMGKMSEKVWKLWGNLSKPWSFIIIFPIIWWLFAQRLQHLRLGASLCCQWLLVDFPGAHCQASAKHFCCGSPKKCGYSSTGTQYTTQRRNDIYTTCFRRKQTHHQPKHHHIHHEVESVFDTKISSSWINYKISSPNFTKHRTASSCWWNLHSRHRTWSTHLEGEVEYLPNPGRRSPNTSTNKKRTGWIDIGACWISNENRYGLKFDVRLTKKTATGQKQVTFGMKKHPRDNLL